jgi:hypothetical protein
VGWGASRLSRCGDAWWWLRRQVEVRAWSKLAEEAEEDDQLSGVELAGATFRPAAGRSASVREA